MLRRFAAIGGVLVLATGCGGGGSGGGGGGPGNELSRRVKAVLTESPDLVGGLEVEDVTCPNITTPTPGDRATCAVHVDGVAPRVDVDIEFAEDGSFDVVNVEF